MSQNTNKFIYVKKNITFPDTGDIYIEKDEVGILIDSNENESIFMVRLWKNVKLNDDDFDFFSVTQTGDGFPSKICNICHKLLPTSNFAKNQNGINNRSVRRPSCQECRKELEGINFTPSDKRIWDKKKPKNEPFECPICNKRTIAGITSKVVLDHDHKTGKIRCWICDSCNTGLGRFKDDIELIKTVITYLEKYS